MLCPSTQGGATLTLGFGIAPRWGAPLPPGNREPICPSVALGIQARRYSCENGTTSIVLGAPASKPARDEVPLRREASRRGLRPRAGWKPALPARYALWRSPLGTW
ncbi:MAG: hypothetical protein GY847_25260 [Proteobacteria bacterium]|nr:hypothetical protein [Pseudomonadota bacterium]